MLVNFVLPNPPHPSSFPNSMLLRESHFQRLSYIKIFTTLFTYLLVVYGRTGVKWHRIKRSPCIKWSLSKSRIGFRLITVMLAVIFVYPVGDRLIQVRLYFPFITQVFSRCPSRASTTDSISQCP